ncbi:MAG: hypothetical protein K0R92_1534 [Lachnospiraceae bacterium]|jgi:hypothetical protein|nr:hypothetical protein [Lachnospiraceae bacterium]
MDTKTLLEQANERVKNINRIMGELEDFEAVLSVTGASKVALHSNGGTTFIDTVLSQDDMIDLQDMVVARIIGARNKKTAELEQLLGVEKRKPATINPKFEKAVQGMENQYKEVIKPLEVPCAEPKEITVEMVKEYYHKRGLSLEESAKELGVPRSTLYNFVTRNNLRKPNKKESVFRDGQAKKERP